MTSTIELASSFIEGAPPGEVCQQPVFPGPAAQATIANILCSSLQMSSPVTCPFPPLPSPTSPPRLPRPHTHTHTDPRRSIDVQALTSEGEDIVPSLVPAFKRYNESQLATVKLPGSSEEVG